MQLNGADGTKATNQWQWKVTHPETLAENTAALLKKCQGENSIPYVLFNNQHQAEGKTV